MCSTECRRKGCKESPSPIVGGVGLRPSGRKWKTSAYGGRTGSLRWESTMPKKAQHKLGKVVNKIKLDNFRESLEHLPEEEVPPTQDDPFGGSEAKDMVLARVRSSQGPGAHAFFRAAPTDDSTERIRLRQDVPGAIGAGTAAPSQPCTHELVHEMEHRSTCMSRSSTAHYRKHSVKHGVESGAPFTGDQNLSIGIHCGQDRGSLQRIVSRVSQQTGIPRRDPRRPASTGTLAERQRNQRWNRSPNFRGAKAPALRSSRIRVL